MANNNLTGKDANAIALHKNGAVEFLRTGAYCNLNDIAKPFGKRLDNWMRLKGTKELFDAFANDPAYGGTEPIKTVVGRMSAPSDLREHSKVLVQQGTFAHPDIAIQFAQWCNPGFALWVSRQIRHLLTYGEVNIHYQEWSEKDRLTGIEYNRDDIKDLYR
jgi:KilA-N domain